MASDMGSLLPVLPVPEVDKASNGGSGYTPRGSPRGPGEIEVRYSHGPSLHPCGGGPVSGAELSQTR